MKKILILLTITVLLAACSSDSDPAVTNDGGRVPLQVTGYIADFPIGITRAHDSSWDTGDEIGIYAVRTNTKPLTLQSDQHAPFKLKVVSGSTHATDEGGTYNFKAFFSNSPVYLPADGYAIDVYGYYPYNADYTNPYAIPVNVSAQNSQNAIDLMTSDKENHTIHGDASSPSINKANPSCQLLFHHRLTKLVFNLKPGGDFDPSDIEGATSLTIGSQKTTATYDIYSDVLTCTGDANQAISAVALATPNSGYAKTFEAMVLPNNDTKDEADLTNHPITITDNPDVDRTVTIVVDGRSYTFTIAKPGSTEGKIKVNNTFEAGTKYIYNVTVYPFSVFVDSQKFTEQW